MEQTYALHKLDPAPLHIVEIQSQISRFVVLVLVIVQHDQTGTCARPIARFAHVLSIPKTKTYGSRQNNIVYLNGWVVSSGKRDKGWAGTTKPESPDVQVLTHTQQFPW